MCIKYESGVISPDGKKEILTEPCDAFLEGHEKNENLKESCDWLLAMLGCYLDKNKLSGMIFDIDELVEFDNARMEYSIDESENKVIVGLKPLLDNEKPNSNDERN